jgi:hypothetical protein
MGEQSENPPEVVKTKQGRERLLELEKTGAYVFHGSLADIRILEPRQGYYLNKQTGQMEKDGNPAVFATPLADVAIFRSLINKEGVSGFSKSSFEIDKDGVLHLSATSNLIEAAKRKMGKVYVLRRSDFGDIEEGGLQCRSERSVTPIEVVEATFKDLPENIRIIDQS